MAKEYKKFKLVYGAENKDIKGSLSGIPAKEDPTIVTVGNYKAKLVYERPAEKAENISELKASLTGIPAQGDRVIGTRRELEGIEVGEDDTKGKDDAKVKTTSIEVPEGKKEPTVTPAKEDKKAAKK